MLALPKTRAEIGAIQAKRKRRAVEQAKRAPFYQGKLDHIDLDRLDDDAWRKIPILDKDMLRALSDGAFYETFCLKPEDGIAEFWRSGGATGTPLFYPRSFEDIRYAMTGFSRIYQCAGCASGGRAHVSFPLGIHPVGQMLARCATDVGIAVNWAGSGTTTPSVMQIELIDRLKPTIWMGMSSYGLHLANLAEARGFDLAASSVETILCSAEPLSDAKRAKLASSVMPMATAAATEEMRMSRLRTWLISWARTPCSSSQVRISRIPWLTHTAACCGLRPVANAFGCGSGDTNSFGIGMSARWQRSRTMA